MQFTFLNYYFYTYLYSMNFYEIFDIPIAPMVDKTILSKKYFELQRMNHPDFFTTATDHEKEKALEYSAIINEAFKTFKDEQKSLAYYLKEKSMINDDEKYILSNDFLMEMMEINEEIMEENTSSVHIKIINIANEMKDAVKDLLIVNETDDSTISLLKLKDYYYKKKYLDRILDRLSD